MGGIQHSGDLLQNFTVHQVVGNLTVLSLKGDEKQKYLMKSYVNTSLDQHRERLKYFQLYQEEMKGNHQIIELVKVVEEKNQTFCSVSYKIHLIFQYSTFSIASQVNERKNNINRIHHRDELASKYFNYEDLCNILYSCLSALWMTMQSTKIQNPDKQLKRFETIFISSKNILIFGDGVIKVMDPFVIGFQNRYSYDKNVYYSPQKLTDFHFVDDQKCAMFQLGMTMLQLSLLESLSSAYKDHQYIEQVVSKKIQKARQIYSTDIQNSLAISVFDLIERMIQTDRDQRFDLEQAIKYAEQMYEDNQSNHHSANESNTTKFYHSIQKKKQLNKTNHSSSARKSSTGNQKFHSFKESIIHQKNICQNQNLMNSPKISNFTIDEVKPEIQEQSSMLQSLTVDNNVRNEVINESLVNGGIFSTLNIGDSYKYNNNFNYSRLQRSTNQQLFTDPQLLRTINRELKQIQQRKNQKQKDMITSQIIQRKNRYYIQDFTNSQQRISNAVYLE